MPRIVQPCRAARRPSSARHPSTGSYTRLVVLAALATILVAPLGALLGCAYRGATAGGSAPGGARSGRNAPDTSSVAIGDGKTLERLFSGRFPGVAVQSTPNGGIRIRIRGGAHSFLANEEPLYVVDGIPLLAGTGDISFLNPYDIAKIEVLKDAADLTFYGVRGANGVIRITTKRPGQR